MEQQEKLLAEREQQLAEGQAAMEAKAMQTAELEQRCVALTRQLEELQGSQRGAEEQQREQRETIGRLESSVAEGKAALAEKARQLLR